MSFVSDLLLHTKEYESPNSFWKWSAYAAIAGVLRDNVWLVDGDSKLFPNIYILLVAGPAQRKGRPVVTAEHLVHLVKNVKVISGRSSIQAILKDIGQTETDEHGKVIRGGSAIFFAQELSAGLVQDDQSIQILTDIYDYKPTGHTTNLIGRGKHKLDQLIFSMMGASNEELLKDVYSSKAIHGGLLGRTSLIFPDEYRKANPFPSGDETRFRSVTDQLKKIGNLIGSVRFAPDAKSYYEKWYIEFREQCRTRTDKAGVLGRLHTHVKKLSLILAANDYSTDVRLCHVEQAVDECIGLLPNYNTFIMSTGKSLAAEAGATILQALAEKDGHMMTRREILAKYWQDISSEVLDEIATTLSEAGMLEVYQHGGGLGYKLTPKCLNTIFNKGNQ